jgi:hypothetical protein
MNAGWRLASVAVPGPAHLGSGTTCQDAAACRAFPWGAVVALADGAGSAPRSAEGAKAAIDGVMAWAETLPAAPMGDHVAAAILDSARDAVHATATELASPPDHLASTLLVAILGSNMVCLTYQLGDGAVVIREAGTWRLALLPARGTYVNETFFVTSADARERQTAEIAREVDAVMLCSDGLEHLVIDAATRQPHAPFFERVAACLGGADDPGEAERVLEALLTSATAARLSGDDKAIAIALCSSAADGEAR